MVANDASMTAAGTPASAYGLSRGPLILGLLFAVLIVSVLVAVANGAFPVSGGKLISIALEVLSLGDRGDVSASEYAVVTQIRVPRVFLGILVGANLAIGGAVMQGMFRNPLADPGLIGVSGGAAVAAIAVTVMGAPAVLGVYALPSAAFLGAIVATSLVYVIGTRGGTTVVATMLLAGIAINALAQSVTGVFVFLSDELQLRSFLFWTLGSLGGAGWPTLVPLIPVLLLPLVTLPLFARGLNAILLGERDARYLGVNTQRLKLLAICLTALGVGIATALSGIIGFVGIVIPHVVRLAFGPDHRLLLPASVLAGAAFMVLADLAARLVVQPAELPIGVVTAAIGAPFFLWLILHRRSYFGG